MKSVFIERKKLIEITGIATWFGWMLAGVAGYWLLAIPLFIISVLIVLIRL
jgi:hypothetical protein